MERRTNMGQQHAQGRGIRGWINTIFHLHGHSHTHDQNPKTELLQREDGVRTVWLAFAALAVTSLIQIVILLGSGSVALLADTTHNIGDALNSLPLLAAFYLARRKPTRRYTYGFGRAEDLAGVLIVVSIAVSALIIFAESIQKLLNPQPMQHIPWVMAAAIIGFVGNEAVALMQIRVGRRMGSEAMIADGLHARVDGFTSLAVLAAAIGTLLGFPILDPIIGLLIGVIIVFITKDAAVRMWYRLMDAVDPTLVDRIEGYSGEIKGVERVEAVRARWAGHQLQAEVTLALQAGTDAQAIQTQVRELLMKHVPYLALLTVETLQPAVQTPSTAQPQTALDILPPRYHLGQIVSAAPMGAAGLIYDDEGRPAWDQIWTGFCDLALAGGPPHRGTLLEPVSTDAIAANPAAYEAVLQELERGIHMVTGLPVQRSATPGWIGLVCASEAMALWLLRAIVVENVSVRREGNILYFPAGPDFRLAQEIKNVITVIAKTNHYWQEHAQAEAATSAINPPSA